MTLDDLTGLRAMGVTAQDVETMRSAGMAITDPGQVAGVKAVMGHRGPPAGMARGPSAIRTGRNGAVAIVSPGGQVTVRGDAATVSAAAVADGRDPDPHLDDGHDD